MGGSIETKEMGDIRRKYPNCKNFIELGTYKGHTAVTASLHFTHVYTMEIVESLHLEAVQHACSHKRDNITFLKGDSREKLPEVMNVVKDDVNVYFIDSHASGWDTSDNGKIPFYKVPMLNELDIITGYSLQAGSVFIIDDIQFFMGNKKEWDWEDISLDVILEKFEKWNKYFYIKQDRLY